jgi:hypothetical protein
LPIMMAESSVASAHSLPQRLLRLQTGLETLTQSLPKTSQGLLTRPFTSLPSAEDIASLETILAGYKAEIQDLRQEIDNLAIPSEKLSSQLASLESRVSSLEDTISELKAIVTSYEQHKQTLQAATETYNEALLNEQAIQQQYDELVASNTSNQEAAKLARTALTEAENALQQAENALNSAKIAFDNASDLKIQLQAVANESQIALDDALEAYDISSDNFSSASSNLQAARSEYDDALAVVTNGDTNLDIALQVLTNKQSAYDVALDEYNDASADLATKQSAKASAQSALDLANDGLDAVLTNLEEKTAQLASANQALVTAETNLFDAQQTFNEAQQDVSDTASALQTATQARAEAASQLSTALAEKNTAQQELLDAATALNVAQTAYDTNLIPDPNWTAPTQQVAHTRLVPQTTTRIETQVIPNILTNSDFSQGTSAWSGVASGWQNSQPGMFNGQIVFSYMTQTVSQGLFSGPFQNATLTLSADWYNDDSNRNLTDVYSMTVEAQDINHNPVGTATYNSTGRHGWENKSVTLTATGPVSYITVSFTGVDSGFWLGDYGPHFKNPSLQVSYQQEITETTYVEETYYTTEPIPAQTGLTVRVYNQLNSSNPQRSDTAYNLCKTTTMTNIQNNWGGGDILGCGGDRVMLHYTGFLTPTENITYLMNQADDGFYMTLDGVPVINNWTLKGCGGNWNSVTLQANRTYAIDAWFFEWGGGACSTLYYQSATSQGVVPAAWYTNAASAPMIHDPARLVALNQAQAVYDEKYSIYQGALDNYNNELVDDQLATNLLTSAQSVYDNAVSTEQVAYDNLLTAQSVYDNALATSNTAEQEVQDAILAVASPTTYQGQMQIAYDDALAAYESALAVYGTKLEALEQTSNELSTAQVAYDELVDELVGPNELLTNKRAELAAAQAAYDDANSAVKLAFSVLQDAQAEHSQNQAALTDATNLVQSSSQDYSEASGQVSTKQSLKDSAAAVLSVAEGVALTSKQQVETVQAQLTAAQSATSKAYLAQTKAEDSVTATEEVLNTKTAKVSTAKREIEQNVLPTLKVAVTEEKQKQTIPTEGSKEIPVLLTPENLMEINLDKVDPTELTKAQAEQLVEAALQTFETAEPGSPEYEQALDALYLAAEQDDIVLPEELAAIPGLQAATELINFLGNAGADMSPAKREEAKKIVVTAVVAAGVAVQAAASAATSAAVSSGSSSGSSSRRTGK